jgi:hypothetical protein
VHGAGHRLAALGIGKKQNKKTREKKVFAKRICKVFEKRCNKN